MERTEALQHISEIVGQDLRAMADNYGITVWRNGKKNKGWAGHAIERYLGLPQNSAQAPNFGSWELKVVPLKRNSAGILCVKETMAITMIDPWEVERTPFEQSHLLRKMTKQVVVSRVFESQIDSHSVVQAVTRFDLDNPLVYAQVRADYETVRCAIRDNGFGSLTGTMGVLVQPRTKGAGHGSTSRAFYARAAFVAHILNIAAPRTGLPICLCG